LSHQQKTVLEQMLQSENTTISNIIKASATVQELENSLVALAKQLAAESSSKREEVKTEAPTDVLKETLQKFSENKVSTQSASLKAIMKILQKVAKKPSDIRTRRLQMSNIVVKKFITNVKGGMELMNACGYVAMEIGEKKTEYLVLKEVNMEVISKAIEMIKERVQDLKSGGPATKAAAPRNTKVMCPCGFWGSTDQGGLCSVCYKKKTFGIPEPGSKVEIKQKSKDAKKTWKSKLKKATRKLSALYRFRLGVKRESRIIQKNKKRCFECNKKVGYLGFECRCMYVFCDLHRFPNAHKCNFDYKRLQQNKLKKENEVVAHEKISKLE